MKMNQRLEEEIEKTLRSIEGMERASPKPFFQTRLEARLSRRREERPVIAWLFRPAWVAASRGLVLLLNLSAVVYMREELAQQEQDTVGLGADWGLDMTVLE